MDSELLIEAALAAATVLGAMAFGFYLQRGCGAIIGCVASAAAALVCLIGARLAGWPGLAGAIVGVAVAATLAAHRFFGVRGARFILLLWLGYSAACVCGYLVGGAVGLAAIALPANVLFWAMLWVLARYVLPLRDSSQVRQAFRSLLTFSLGTNYPFHVLNGRTLEQRVPGNPYRSFFAGPGIVITSCDHLVVITDGNTIRVPEEPGLTFTGRFEVVQRVLDLRPQLRSFYVDKVATLDGIAIQVEVFIAFRLHWGGQTPAEGRPFPFQRRAAFQAVTGEKVEQAAGMQHKWDGLIEIHGVRIMRDIISRYRFDELCLALGPTVSGPGDVAIRYAADETATPHDARRDPRYRIRDDLISRLARQMKPLGIEVLGGGISNLTPVDAAVSEQRLKNWLTRWQSRIRATEAQEEALKYDLVEQSQAGVEQMMFLILAQLLSDAMDHGQDMSEELLAATYIASLERMAQNAQVKELLGHDTQRKLTILYRSGKALLLPGVSRKEVTG